MRCGRSASGTGWPLRSACGSCATTSRSRGASPGSRRTPPIRSASTTRNSSSPSTPTTRPSSSTWCTSCARPSRVPTRTRRRRSSPASEVPSSALSTRWTASTRCVRAIPVQARRSGRRRSVLRRFEQLLEGAQLHARAPVRLARVALRAVHRLPAGVAHGLGLTLREQRLHRLAIWVAWGGQLPGVEVREHRVDRLLRVTLVGPDDPGGTALNPADRVLAAPLEHSPALVRDHAATLVEGHSRDASAAVADRAEHEPAVELLSQLGRARPHHPDVVLDQLVVHDADALDALAAEDLHRRHEESQHDPAALAERLARGVATEDVHVLLRGGVRRLALDECLRERVQLGVAGVYEH